MKAKRTVKWGLWVLFFCGQCAINGFAQKAETEQKIDIPSSVKEELHRYMGYEELLPKYVSIPYDVTMNTNVTGSFIDISLLFLLFIPIVLLVGFKKVWVKLVFGLLLFLFLITGITTGYSSLTGVPVAQLDPKLAKDIAAFPYEKAPLTNLKLTLTRYAADIYQKVDTHIVQQFSGEGDRITYSLIVIAFVGLFFLLSDRISTNSKGEKAVFYLLFLYSFLWLILGAGVVWYGILVIGLGLAFIVVSTLKKQADETGRKWLQYSFLLISLVWVGSALSYRLSNYNEINSLRSQGIPDINPYYNGAVHDASLFYGLGKLSKDEVMDFLFPNYRMVVTEINSNKAASVYRIGTYFQYFIDNNHERVTDDNQLEFFEVLYTQIPDKVKLAKALKKTGYEYLIVDLNVASIDFTPERSLERKTKMLSDFLVNNSAIQLIATDRIVMNDQGQLVYSLAGRNVQNNGSFAAFKIK